MMNLADRHYHVGMVLFDGFELLDVTGPLEILGRLPRNFTISLIGESRQPVRSHQGVSIVPDVDRIEAATVDLLMVPGGQGTRTLVHNLGFLAWLSDYGHKAKIIASICTGSALLGAAGLLDGYRATSNKRAFDWVQSVAPQVQWEPKARWVAHLDRWSSSGVAAGMDMTLALVAQLVDEPTARELAAGIEYEWHEKADWDPFAASTPAMAQSEPLGIITVFRSRLRKDHANYESLADELEHLAREQPGFRSFKTFVAQDGERCSIAVFRDEQTQRAWKTYPLHAEAQRRAIEEFYTEFLVQVGQISHEVRAPD